MSLQTTASQTVGPYLHIGLTWLVTDNLVAPGVTGTPITLEGRITDGDGAPVSDALVEIWQANANGRYAHPEDTRDVALEPAWKGFGRVPTDDNGVFRFTTIKPGRVPAADGRLQAPHINVLILMRGMLKQLTTRLYFPDDPANADDAVLQSVPAARRNTLIAQPVAGPAPGRPKPGLPPVGEARSASGASSCALKWDVRLQGDGETVFFEY